MRCERVALCAYEGSSFVEIKRTSPVYTGCTSKEVALWFIACYWHLCPAGFFSGPILCGRNHLPHALRLSESVAPTFSRAGLWPPNAHSVTHRVQAFNLYLQVIYQPR